MSSTSRETSLLTPGTPASPDSVRAMDSLRRLVHALRTASRVSENSVGLSAAQHFVLRQLERSSALSPGDLAARAHTAASSVSEVVARLVERGLVARVASAADRRRIELRLTEAGAALIARAPQTVQERLLAGLERLSATERFSLVSGLESWIDAAGLGDTQPVLFFEDEAGHGRGR
jgi:DNA-binding MarR family transcriptional regulator